MHNQIALACVKTPLGEIGLAAGEHGLFGVSFDGEVEHLLGNGRRRRDRGKGRYRPADVLEQACAELVEYMLSAREKFETPLDLSSGSEFQRTVWRRLQKLKFGSVITYAELAQSSGHRKATRAVGNAVGANPLPIFIPCHRVLAAGRKLGGFSGGTGCKKKLLRLEGVQWN